MGIPLKVKQLVLLSKEYRLQLSNHHTSVQNKLFCTQEDASFDSKEACLAEQNNLFCGLQIVHQK
jgi:hypothetical protein